MTHQEEGEADRQKLDFHILSAIITQVRGKGGGEKERFDFHILSVMLHRSFTTQVTAERERGEFSHPVNYTVTARQDSERERERE